MSDQIALLGISAKGFHGVLDFEKRDGQTFVVDVVMDVDLAPAGASDDLADTVNYAEVAGDVVGVIEGEPLDPKTLLYTEDGKPRVAIVSIAHLGDAERMFIVSLLLNQTLGWVREKKFWPAVGRLNNVLGDRKLICSCPPIENYIDAPPAA